MPNPLLLQLIEKRFEHGLAYVRHESHGLKKLTSAELAHLNEILTGNHQDEPWRFDSVEIKIPSGHVETFSVLSNPLARAREILGDAFEMAGNQRIFEAAFYVYTQLILEHLFKDANRRTAVLAMVWLLNHYGIDLDAKVLVKIPVGNLRLEKDIESLKEKILKLINP